jgi:hypothetical protein
MMLGAGSRLTPVNDTITLRDGHPCHLALATGPLRHLMSAYVCFREVLECFVITDMAHRQSAELPSTICDSIMITSRPFI